MELGAESPKSAMCRQQKCGKQPAFPWHCQLSQYPQTLRPELVHQGPHWIEAFDLSKVEGLTGHPLEATLNEEKEKRKVDKNRTLSYSSVVFSGYVFFDYFAGIETVEVQRQTKTTRRPVTAYATRRVQCPTVKYKGFHVPFNLDV